MNIFIKFYIIISILIGLNSSAFVNIKIYKEGFTIRNEPKNFEGTNGQFLVKLAKWSNGEWEYASEEECIKPHVSVPLKMPEEWYNLFESERNRDRFKRNRPKKEPFWLAVKVEMVDNKMIEPIPFILHENNQFVRLNLKEENGKIVGSCANSIGQSNWAIEEYLNKIKEKKSSSSNNVRQLAQNSFLIDFSTGLSAQNLDKNEQKMPSIFPPIHQNPTKHSSVDMLKQWHKTNQQLKAQIHQMKNANYFNEAGNIDQIPVKNIEISEQRHGKGIMSENEEADEMRAKNWPQMGQKLMQVAMNSSHGQTIPLQWQGGQQQNLSQKIQKHGKGTEIGDALENQTKKQKLMPENYSPFHLHRKEHLEHQNSLQTENFSTVSGHKINKGGIQQIDEHGRGQHELAQINPNGFTKANIPTNAGKPIGEWHQNFPVQQMNAGEFMEDELAQFNSSGFTRQGDLPQIDETETDDPMQFWRQIYENLSPKPGESLIRREHELTQINPSGFTHQCQGNNISHRQSRKGGQQQNLDQNVKHGNEKEDNYTEIGGDKKRTGNRSHIRQLAKLAISKEWQRLQQHFDEVGKQPKLALQSPIPPHLQEDGNLGQTKNLATAEHIVNEQIGHIADEYGRGQNNLRAIDQNEEESELSNIFTFDRENPSFEQILSESSNSHSGKSE